MSGPIIGIASLRKSVWTMITLPLVNSGVKTSSIRANSSNLVCIKSNVNNVSARYMETAGTTASCTLKSRRRCYWRLADILRDELFPNLNTISHPVCILSKLNHTALMKMHLGVLNLWIDLLVPSFIASSVSSLTRKSWYFLQEEIKHFKYFLYRYEE